MIVRRRHNSRFAALPNAIWEDEHLDVDAKGVLGYLLSRPHDWHVHLRQVAKVLKVGRDRLQRIFRDLIAAGYVVREQPRLEGGVFGPTEYVVWDEATSPPSDLPVTGVSSLPQPEKPAPVQPEPENTVADNNKERIYTKTNLTKDAGARATGDPVRGSANNGLTKLIALWPPDHVLSKRAAEQAWQRIAEPDRKRLIDCAGPYLSECRQVNRKVCDLKTYIAERRDERIAPASRAAQSITVAAQCPEWTAWRQHRIANGESVGFMDAQAAKGVGWSVPSQWPPDASLPKTVGPRTGSPRSAAVHGSAPS